MKYRIKAGCLIDGKNPPKRNVQIDIESKKIKDIAEISSRKKDLFDKVINAEKYTVLPGLIDTHVHITMHPEYTNTKDWCEWLKEKKEFIVLKSAENARKMLLSGITTARDCGAYSDLSFLLREGINRKYIPGPRLIISGNNITITGGHGYFMGLEADDKIELIKSVRLMNKLGADFIKLMSTGGRLTTLSNARGVQYNLEETKVVVEEAHQRNMKVAVHALGTEGIVNSVKASVDTIEHCAWLAPVEGFDLRKEIIPEMVEKNIYVNPTLPAALASLNRTFFSADSVAIFEERMELMKIMYQAGIKMLAGTDAGVPEVDFDQLPFSIKLLADKIGLTNYDAIKAGTSEAARALGVDNEVGTVEKGKLADLIIIKGDPLEDLEALKKIFIIIKDGDIIFQDNKMII